MLGRGCKGTMRILRGKIRKNASAKLAGYFAAAYLLASWGVNGVVNPMHYVRNVTMKQMELQETGQTIEQTIGQKKGQEDSLVLTLPPKTETYDFLSFQIVQSKEYSFHMVIAGETPNGSVEEMDIKVWRGWNTVDISKKQWNKIYIRQGTGSEKLEFESFLLTQYRKADIGKMLSVMASLAVLSAFWESVWWIKKKYAA